MMHHLMKYRVTPQTKHTIILSVPSDSNATEQILSVNIYVWIAIWMYIRTVRKKEKITKLLERLHACCLAPLSKV
jgi:hypothetical protein